MSFGLILPRRLTKDDQNGQKRFGAVSMATARRKNRKLGRLLPTMPCGQTLQMDAVTEECQEKKPPLTHSYSSRQIQRQSQRNTDSSIKEKQKEEYIHVLDNMAGNLTSDGGRGRCFSRKRELDKVRKI